MAMARIHFRRSWWVVLVAVLLSGCRAEGPLPAAPPAPCDPRWDYRLSEVWAPAWSPDGNEVAFDAAHGPDGNLSPGIYITNVLTRETRKAYDEQYPFTWIEAISWSPSGKSLLVSRARWLYIFDLETKSMRLLNAQDELMLGGAWSAEGDSIYYTREGGSLYENALFVTSLAGGVGRLFVPDSGATIYPVGEVSISPDGEQLTFAQLAREPDGSLRNGGEIFLIRCDGSGLRQLTNLRGYNGHPKWIDGGRAILFDHLPEECYNVTSRPGHSWIIEVGSGVIYQSPRDVGDPRVQFGFPPAIDRTGTRAAAVSLDRNTGYGALWLMTSHGTARRLLFSPKLKGWRH